MIPFCLAIRAFYNMYLLQNMNVSDAVKIGSLSTTRPNCLTRDRRGNILDSQRYSPQTTIDDTIKATPNLANILYIIKTEMD